MLSASSCCCVPAAAANPLDAAPEAEMGADVVGVGGILVLLELWREEQARRLRRYIAKKFLKDAAYRILTRSDLTIWSGKQAPSRYSFIHSLIHSSKMYWQ